MLSTKREFCLLCDAMQSPAFCGPVSRRQHGFTYMFVIFLVLLMGIVAAATGTVWRIEQLRDKEAQLLFVGSEFRRAITAYAASNPNAPQPYPRTLEELLQDSRQLTVRRYLRKIYVDPMTGRRDWGLIRSPAGGIVGVYSRSETTPLKQANFPLGNTGFSGARRHSEWRFIAANAPVASANALAGVSTGSPNTPPPADPVDPAGAVSVDAASDVPASPARRAINIAALARIERTDKTQNRCDAVQQIDANLCGQVAAKWDKASGDACLETAAVRYSACVADPQSALPVLEMRHF